MDVAATGKTNKRTDNIWELLAVIFKAMQKECYWSYINTV